MKEYKRNAVIEDIAVHRGVKVVLVLN